MASSKDFAKSVVHGSEETFDICCSPCTEGGKTKEAKHFCVECESSFCEDCLLDHNKFPALRSHQILDRSGKKKGDQREAEVALPTERCAIHHGKLIDMFCGDHDDVCCAACIALKHRSCVNVDYLPDIAQCIRDSTEMKDTERSLNNALSRMKQQRETRKGNFTSLDQEKDRSIDEVEKYESELIKRIKELAEDAKQLICSKHDEYRKVVQSDVDTLDTAISTASTYIQTFSGTNEAQLFVNIKAGKKSTKDYETLLRDLSSGKTKNELKFKLNVGLKDGLTTLGSISTDNKNIKEYKATLYGNFEVADNNCDTIFLANFEKGLLALTREGKTRWKFTDPELKGTWCVCVLLGDIALVSGYNSKSILQVDKNGKKIGKLLGPSENLRNPFALAFDRNTSRLLVGYSSNQVHVYTLSKIE